MYTAVHGTWLNILYCTLLSRAHAMLKSFYCNINDVICSCYYVLLILAPPPSKGDVLEQVMVVLNGQ